MEEKYTYEELIELVEYKPRNRPSNNRPILMFSRTGEFLKRFPCKTRAKQWTGYVSIRNFCRDDFIFIYEDEFSEELLRELVAVAERRKTERAKDYNTEQGIKELLGL